MERKLNRWKHTKKQTYRHTYRGIQNYNRYKQKALIQIYIRTDSHKKTQTNILILRCDPPCIPYLGIYLSDLTFIDEGTPNFTENGLLNFAKMRMVRHFQYRFETDYSPVTHQFSAIRKNYV